MLSARHKQRGTTLIELLVGLVVLLILLRVAAPSFRNWMQSAQIRVAAESIQDGLQLALSNAVTFNNAVNFVLPGSDSTWTVGCLTPTSRCPAIIQGHSSVEGTRNAVVAATQNSVSFNGLGRITPTPGGNIVFAVRNPTVGGLCAPLGPMRCLNVQVSAGGDIRICDPVLPAYPADPQGC